jgi:hypothetical protein
MVQAKQLSASEYRSHMLKIIMGTLRQLIPLLHAPLLSRIRYESLALEANYSGLYQYFL